MRVFPQDDTRPAPQARHPKAVQCPRPENSVRQARLRAAPSLGLQLAGSEVAKVLQQLLKGGACLAPNPGRGSGREQGQRQALSAQAVHIWILHRGTSRAGFRQELSPSAGRPLQG